MIFVVYPWLGVGFCAENVGCLMVWGFLQCFYFLKLASTPGVLIMAVIQVMVRNTTAAM